MAGLIHPGDCKWVLPPLENAKVSKIRHAHADHGAWKNRAIGLRMIVEARQTWLVRPVIDGSAVGILY